MLRFVLAGLQDLPLCFHVDTVLPPLQHRRSPYDYGLELLKQAEY